MFTTKAVRFALFAVALAAPSLASAKPRHVAVVDLDGPRGLADAGKQAVIAALSAGNYDLVSGKNWLEAKAAAARKAHGPAVWAKASKAAGVDAVVEGWVQDEGRSKVLTLVVTDASDGNEQDQLTIKLPSKGFNADVTAQITKGLEDRFEWIEPVNGTNPDPLPPYKPEKKIGSKRTTDDADETSADDRRGSRKRDDRDDDRRGSRRRDDDRRDDRDDDRRPSRKRDDRRDDRADDRRELGSSRDRDDRRDTRDDNDDVTEKRVATVEPKTKTEKENEMLGSVFAPPTEEEIIINPKRAHTPRPTIKAMVSGGGYMSSRTLYVAAETDGATQYAGVPNKGLEVGATFYPFPTKKIDGIQSGIGFSFGAGHSLGSTVTFDDGEAVGDYVINQSSWDLGVHWRQPLGDTFAIDAVVGYGASNYKIEDAPMTFEVPDTSYQFLSAGGHLDMKITDNSSVGFGAKYLYVLGAGDLNSQDWYGPGKASGWNFETNFIIPLPKDLYIEGQLSYQRIKTSFDGVGQITEDEGVSEAVDSSIGANVKVGIKF